MQSAFHLRRFSSLALCAIALCASTRSARAQYDITRAGDPIVAIYNTVAGGNSTASTAGTGIGQYPAAEAAPNAIDNNTATKYLNFGAGTSGQSSATQGTMTGFYVTPSAGSSILTGIRFATANDAAARDPLQITLEGTNATGAALDQGASYSLIYSGTTGLATDPGRLTLGPVVNFTNTNAYTTYRLLVTAQRGVANSVQFSEVQLLVPEPGSLALLALSGGLLVRRRRA